jgi:hypothetical protein
MKGIFMKKDKEIEEILLNDSVFEQVVKVKIEHDFNKELEDLKVLNYRDERQDR